MRPGMRLFALLSASMAVAAVVPAPAAAADELKFEITPFVSYRFGGDFDVEGSTASYSVDDSEAFGLLFNVRQSSNTQWEVLYSFQDATASLRDSLTTLPSVDMDIHVLQLGGTYQGDGATVRPYLAMTLGGTYIETTANGTQSDAFFSGSIGVGMNIIPSSRLGIRLEARAYATLMNSNTDLFCRTGPDMNICAIRIDGSLLSQFEIFAGVVFRF